MALKKFLTARIDISKTRSLFPSEEKPARLQGYRSPPCRGTMPAKAFKRFFKYLSWHIIVLSQNFRC
jgi:hypothetical protein